jgi:hypothetical protein
MSERTKPLLAIKRVKDITFSVNELLFVPDLTKEIKIKLNQRHGANTERNLVDFTIHIFLHYDNSEDVLAGVEVQNIFEVSNLKDFAKPEQLELPVDIWVSIISMAITHGRALFAKNLAGTVYQDIILPILNPYDVAKHFLPDITFTINERPELHKPRKKRVPKQK